jgi:colicin import membrane protein
LLDHALPSLEEGRRLWKWVLFSAVVHVGLISGLFISPFFPSRKVVSYPVYTVDLVGGDRIGAEVVGPAAAPAPQKQETKKAKAESQPRVEEVKKKQVAEIPVKAKEKEAVKESKKEIKKEVKAEQGLSEKMREKLIQSALERVKDRAQQKGKDAQAMSSGSGEGQGAASLGEGGRGGGIVKGVEFLAYHNRMLSLIRDRWAWAGRRSDLEVTVRFAVQENGEITGLKILKRSGDASFDDSVFRAVSKATPLPPPPENYRKDFMDVELTFRPKDLAGG